MSVPARATAASPRPRVDQRTRLDAASDFGGVVRRFPAAVLLPRSAAEVAVVVRRAGEEGADLVVRGSGHGVAGACTGTGWVADLRHLGRLDVEAGIAWVGAGVPWDAVVEAALSAGLLPPVVPDSLLLSVTGTVVAGGYGDGSARHGSLAGQITEAEMVIDGAVHRLGAGDARQRLVLRREQGVPLILTAVGLRLQRAPAPLATVTTVSGMVGELVERARAAGDAESAGIEVSLRGPAGFAGTLTVRHDPGRVPASVAKGETSTLPWATHFDRAAPVAHALRHCANPWFSAFVPDDGVERLIATVMAQGVRLLGARGCLVIRPVRHRDAMRWLVDVIRVLEPPRADVVDAALAANRDLATLTSALGGEMYQAATILGREPG